MHEPAPVEDENDELVLRVGVRLDDEDDAIAGCVGELDLTERRCAEHAPASPNGATCDPRKPDLPHPRTQNDELRSVGERPSRRARPCLGRAIERRSAVGCRHPLLGRLLLHDRPARADSELRPRPLRDVARADEQAVGSERAQQRRVPGGAASVNDVHRPAGADCEVARHRSDLDGHASDKRTAPPSFNTVVHFIEQRDRAVPGDVERRRSDPHRRRPAQQASLSHAVTPRCVGDARIGSARRTERVRAERDGHRISKRKALLRRIGPGRGNGQFGAVITVT